LIDLPDYEFVKVFCYSNETKFENKDFENSGEIPKKDLVHKEIIPLIKVFEHIEHKEKIPNVLLLFFDSVSYLQFERHFPRMKSFVGEHKFYEMKGYNKVAVNTFPNIIPLLTGLFHKELAIEEELDKIYFDNWPIIWKKFSIKGFRILYIEDMYIYGLFTTVKKGFTRKPTDYYLRPFTKGIYGERYLDFCYNGKTEDEVNLVIYCLA
jgi:hypothetical protein